MACKRQLNLMQKAKALWEIYLWRFFNSRENNWWECLARFVYGSDELDSLDEFLVLQTLSDIFLIVRKILCILS